MIPASVEGIGDYAFKAYSSMKSLSFEEGSNLTTIGVQAFYGVSKIEECIIPSKVTTIGNYAFRVNSGLKRFYYPSKVNNFGTQVFSEVESLDYLGRYTITVSRAACADENKDHKCDYGCSKITEHTWDKGVVTKEATAAKQSIK